MGAHSPDTIAKPRTAVEELHRYFVDLQYQLREMPERFIVISELVLHAQRDLETLRILSASDRFWSEYLIKILDQGMQEQMFRSDLNTMGIALAIMSFCRGICMVMNVSAEEIAAEVDRFEQYILTMAKR